MNGGRAGDRREREQSRKPVDHWLTPAEKAARDFGEALADDLFHVERKRGQS